MCTILLTLRVSLLLRYISNLYPRSVVVGIRTFSFSSFTEMTSNVSSRWTFFSPWSLLDESSSTQRLSLSYRVLWSSVSPLSLRRSLRFLSSDPRGFTESDRFGCPFTLLLQNLYIRVFFVVSSYFRLFPSLVLSVSCLVSVHLTRLWYRRCLICELFTL